MDTSRFVKLMTLGKHLWYKLSRAKYQTGRQLPKERLRDSNLTDREPYNVYISLFSKNKNHNIPINFYSDF